MTDTIFADANLRATLFKPDAAKLIVTFDNRKPNKTEFEPRDPARHFLKAGFAQLHIATRANDWFINASTREMERALSELKNRYAPARAIGFSMGGYGALRFSGALGLEEVVLISPQVSIAPDIVPFETRYKRESRGFDADIGALDSANPDLGGLICYDPFHRLDTAHAALITTLFPKMRRVPMAFGQHPATNILRERKAIGRVQRQVIRGLDPRQLKADHRAACMETALYWDRLAAQAKDTHPAWAACATQRAQEIRTKKA